MGMHHGLLATSASLDDLLCELPVHYGVRELPARADEGRKN